MQASHLRRGPTAGHSRKAKHGSVAAQRPATVHPRAIDDSRATEIQTALVKAGYLSSASGHWDEESAAAMRKLQGDNGWQTKLIPDSRALIKLGLGPGSEAPTGTTAPSGSVSQTTGSGAANQGLQ